MAHGGSISILHPWTVSKSKAPKKFWSRWVRPGQQAFATAADSSCFSLASTRFSWHCGILLWGGKVCGGHRQRHQDWGHKTAHLALYCDETGTFYLKQLLKWEAIIFCRENNGNHWTSWNPGFPGGFSSVFSHGFSTEKSVLLPGLQAQHAHCFDQRQLCPSQDPA